MQKLIKVDLRHVAIQKYGVAFSHRLAVELGVSRQTIYNWLAGRSIPVSKDIYIKLGAIFPDTNPHLFFVLDLFSTESSEKFSK